MSPSGVPDLRDVAADALDARQLHDLLRLRAEVFVVEQRCPYLDPDGRDLEPGARHLWCEADGAVVACARVLDDGTARRIGRIATTPPARGRGLAAALVERFLATSTGPWVLDAQSHLRGWYARFGFVPSGPEYLEDDIAHTPMRREADPA